MTKNRLVVCVPARNEAERLPWLLDSLASQTTQQFLLVLALNNTTDNSVNVIAAAREKHPTLQIVVDEIAFPDADAHAGSARRRAMDLAASLAGRDGLILTTDADTRPPRHWIERNIDAMDEGLDIVGGRLVLDENETIAKQVIEAWLRAERYWRHIRAIEDEIDPVPWDPPPRHGDHTGASLCLTVAAYRACGGLPPLRSGEDRALVRAVVRNGGRLAHPDKIWTRVSPRIQGRAANGMADHMKQLQESGEFGAGVELPSFSQWRVRAHWRHGIRRQGGAALVAELEDRLPPMVSDMLLSEDVFGLAV